MIHPEDDRSSLERAKERLYKPNASISDPRAPLAERGEPSLQHTWAGETLMPPRSLGERHIRFAGVFFIVAFAFFVIALAGAGYLFYFGGNSVSVDKIAIAVQGPTTIAGGDTVPLSLTITNKNPVAIEDAKLEIDFPEGTRSADDLLQPYPRYTEDLGALPSGATVTRSIKAVVFGEAGQALSLPVSLSYGTAGTSVVFQKKASYELSISSTPLSLSVDTLAETVSGQPLTFTLRVRSNASVPLANVVLAGAFPFGFSITSSSLPHSNSTFFIGTMAPGATKTITLTGLLTGQESEERVFRFTVGTAKSETDRTLAIPYMTQSASVALRAPFISTTLAINGDPSKSPVLVPKNFHDVSVSYTNTLSTSVHNATISIALSGNAIDYGSIRTTNGFYRSSDHTILFSKDADPALATLAPGASGVGSFTFSTLPPDSLPSSPSIAFSVSVSGTRVGQSNVPENVSSVTTKVAKIATTVALAAESLHSEGPLGTSGPIPPRANEATTYAVIWRAVNKGSAVADATVRATLPAYVDYADKTAGSGSFSYDSGSRTVTWNIGNLADRGTAQGAFLVSLTPSTSQRGSAPALTSRPTFSGHDRYAGIQVSAAADPVTTETTGDPGYSSDKGIVQ